MRNFIQLAALSAICLVPVVVPAGEQPKSGAKQPALEGFWLGTLDAGIVKLRLVLEIKKNDQGKYQGTMEVPEQGNQSVKMDGISVDGDQVKMKWSKILADYEGKFAKEGKEITGKFRQAGQSFDVTFQRIKQKPALVRPQEPKKPYPYLEEEVTYENKEAKIKLAGTLTMPKPGGPHPVVLLITGSGPQDRNEALMGHKPFLVLADHLTRHGIAVLRVDDRGVGGSTGNVLDATIPNEASDVLAGIAYLKTRKEINPKQIGLIGHSEGGVIAPLVATQSDDVAFIVMLAGTGVPGEEILFMQGQAIFKAMGVGERELKRIHEMQKQVFAIARQEKDVKAALPRVQKLIEDLKAKMTDEEKKALQGKETAIKAQVAMIMSPWFKHFLDYDPRPALRKVRCPVLALIGEKDLQVPPRENLKQIAIALAEGGNQDFTIRELPRLNHLFQTAKTGAVSEYALIEETIAPVALNAMSNWILARTLKK
jgi:pimeloyl-ACP methyl ester carboxylesterase